MAHKKGVGSTRNGRDSNSQRRGTKAHSEQFVTGGSIVIRQCGNKWYPGRNTGQGKDYTNRRDQPKPATALVALQ